MLAMLGMAIFASFATYWPYNLAPSWKHYTMGFVDAEVGDAFLNSLKLAAGTAFFGTIVVFVGAYMLEKTRGLDALRPLVRLLAMLPMAVPGLVLGLGYIFFFNAPDNPLHGLYQTLALLVVCTIVHFYTTGHLTAVTALKSLDAEFEAVSASLKVPFFKTFWRVTLPICTPTLIDIARYFFINAMTTISAVVFLYSPETKVAAIAILNLDEAGEAGASAACAVLITAGSTVVTLLFMALGAWVDRSTQAWRRTERPLATLRTTTRSKTETNPMERDAILLTPGPLTTTERTKRAMLRDWGSWDSSFIAVTDRAAPPAAGDRPWRRLARRRAAAGQRHLRRRGRGGDDRAEERPHPRARQRRLLQAARPAGDADGPQDDDPRPRRGRSRSRRPSSSPRCAPMPASPTSA